MTLRRLTLPRPTLRRHDLAYLRPDASFRFLCAAEFPTLETAVAKWISEGRPLVVARQALSTGENHGETQLAVTLPARLGRKKVACIFQRSDIVRTRAALQVAECRLWLGNASYAVLAELAQRFASGDAELGVYGSLAWEVLADEAYRHAGSDLDVICDIRSHAQLEIALNALTAASVQLPCRLDGEIRFPDDNAVAWRELAAAYHDADAVVLAKGQAEVQMVRVRTLLASLMMEPCDV